MMIKTVIFLVVLLLDVAAASADNNDATAIDAPALPIGVIDPQLLAVGYSGNEKLVYDVSWSGGLKIGELHLEVNVLPEVEDGYEIRAFVTTKNGALNLIYPIEDLHVTKVRGPNRLPYHYEIWQKEGYNYRAHRVFEYDQNSGYIRYLKNEKVQSEYRISGETNNEFSSFFNSRLMAFDIGGQFVVPTFADKRKVDVVVHAVARKKFEDTIIGSVSTVEIMPVLIFEGLYEKKGDTVIWYTDDECRIPVRINSKITIGSLTAKLTEYENSACKLYSAVKK
jgi:hypothetical protein